MNGAQDDDLKTSNGIEDTVYEFGESFKQLGCLIPAPTFQDSDPCASYATVRNISMKCSNTANDNSSTIIIQPTHT